MTLIPVDDFWLNGWGPLAAGHDYDEPGWTYDQGVAWDGSAWTPIDTTTLPAAFVQVAFANNPLDSFPTWTTLDGVLDIAIDAGRNHPLQRVMAGTLNVTVDNRRRHYDPTWTGGPYGSGLVPLKQVRVLGGYNLLTQAQSSIEGGALSAPPGETFSSNGWVPDSNVTVHATNETTAQDGIYTLRLTAKSTADVFVNTGKGVTGSPFGANVPFAARVDLLAKTTGRSVAIEVYFYDDSATFLSQQNSFWTDAANTWTTLYINGVSPANTAYATVSVHIVGCVAGEVHYLDKAGLWASHSPTPTWTRGSLATLFSGFVESWTVNRQSAAESTTTLVAADLFKLLSYKRCRDTKYRDAVRALNPDVYYRLDERPPPASRESTIFGAFKDQQGYQDADATGSPTTGVAGPLVTDPTTGTAGSNDKGNVYIPGGLVKPGVQNAFTVMLWLKTGASGVNVSRPDEDPFRSGQRMLFGYITDPDAAGTGFALWLGSTPWRSGNTTVLLAVVSQYVNGPHTGVFTDGSLNVINDDVWHHITVTRSSDGLTMSIYVDGVLAQLTVDQSPGATPTANATANTSGVWLSGAGSGDTDSIAQKDVAVWNSVCLSASQIAAVYANAAFPSETVGARLRRLLNLVGPMPLIADAGPELEAFTSDLTQSAVLEHMQTCVDSDGGVLFADGLGVPHYQALAHAVPAPSAIFSDTGGAGELPYGPGPGPSIDDQDIWNEISVSGRSCGSVLEADDTSQTANGTRTKSIQSEELNNADAVTTASTLLARYKTPVPRVGQMDFYPQSSPVEGFTQVTGRKLLDRITYKIGGVPGNGSTPTSSALFIEHLRHEIRPLQLWKWSVSLSPY